MVDEAYNTAIVRTITQPLLVLDEEFRVVSANTAFMNHFQLDPAQIDDALLYELGNGQWDIAQLRHLLDDVLDDGTSPVENYRVEHDFEDLGHRIMLLNAHRMRREDGPDRILVAISDVTEREQLIFELEGRKEFAEKLVDSMREALLVLGRDLRVHSANQSFYDTFGVASEGTEGLLVYELGDGQWDMPELRQLLEDVLPKEQAFNDYEVEHEFETIGRRVMRLNGRRIDHLNLILLTIHDVTEARRVEALQRAMMGELQHRVKNILNNVSALAAMTRRQSRDLDQFFDAFSDRLGALARTQELLVQGPGGAVDIRAVLRLELGAVGAEEGRDYTAHGPAIAMAPNIAQPLAMTVHELTTNATKYGALSADGGRIEIAWTMEQRNDGPRVALNWRERGVTMIQTGSQEKGFGSRLIETTLPHTLGGTVNFRIERDGAVCEMEFPIST